jgi:inhibitor of cysteine peptidase
MDEKQKHIIYRLAIVLILGITGLVFLFIMHSAPRQESSVQKPDDGTPRSVATIDSIGKFSSEQEFKEYIASAQESASAMAGSTALRAMEKDTTSLDATSGFAVPQGTGLPGGNSAAAPSPQRFSQTNVQVSGIDEPDMVKTDGKKIYLSSQQPMYEIMSEPMIKTSPTQVDMVGPAIYPPPIRKSGETNVLNAFPAQELAKEGKIDKQGNLLLIGTSLVIFADKAIYGYDVSDPKNPKDKWEVDLNDNSMLVEARARGNDIYVVQRTYINETHPCPFEPMAINGSGVSISCPGIYHPVQPISVDSTYSVIALDARSGSVGKSTSFVGSQQESAVYMNENNLFLTYSYPGDIIRVMSGMFKENKDLFPDTVIAKLEKLNGYDLSSQAKMIELGTIIEGYTRTLDSDARLKFDNEMQNRGESYFEKHKRELEQTGIAKISLDDLNVAANGAVPGRVLNQFSLDEYDGSLRVATTVGGWWGMWSMGSNGKSANDVYVLDGSLTRQGSILDLGKEERIYSARFMGDRGYLVTFKQTDPFYILDLSDPKNPKRSGELKIPGYSSYLHPLGKNLVLGIGKEDAKVKVSLFDVSDATDPREVSKYVLDEYWSDALDTHHAFLADEQRSIFFVPGSAGGYVFSYKGDELKLAAAISDIQAKRALYVDHYLYVIAQDKIVVYDEDNWGKVNQLVL